MITVAVPPQILQRCRSLPPPYTRSNRIKSGQTLLARMPDGLRKGPAGFLFGRRPVVSRTTLQGVDHGVIEVSDQNLSHRILYNDIDINAITSLQIRDGILAAGALDPLREGCLDEVVDIAVKHDLGIRARHARAQILHHLIGL